jgi:hypothetical protein
MQWIRGSATLTLSINLHTFEYSAELTDACGMAGGGFAFRCDGKNYSSWEGLLTATNVTQHSAADERLGGYDAVRAHWSGAPCQTVTEIRHYASAAAFTFHALFPAGVNGSNVSALPSHGVAGPIEPDVALASAFPSWAPGSGACAHLVVHGNSLGQNFRAAPDLSSWEGGLEGGPLLLFGNGSAASNGNASAAPSHPPAMVLSALAHAKSMIGQGDDGRLSFGVHGYVERLPEHFEQRVVLVGRQGIAAATHAWGKVVRRASGTTRMALEDDLLNRKVSYWTDNGAYYCYCNRYIHNRMPGNASQHWTVPMHTTIEELRTYHDSLGLQIELYHLDRCSPLRTPHAGCLRQTHPSPCHSPHHARHTHTASSNALP